MFELMPLLGEAMTTNMRPLLSLATILYKFFISSWSCPGSVRPHGALEHGFRA
jgi:hypothetical protein